MNAPLGQIVCSLLLILATLPGHGCDGNGRVSILVGAASSLRAPIERAKLLYSESHPDVEIVVSYAGSGTIRRQIEFGAPIDLFVSASPEHIDSLLSQGLVLAQSRRTVTTNTLVLISPVQRPPLVGVEGLRLPAVTRIALGDPKTVPAGRYAIEVLDHLHLTNDLKEKFVYTKDVIQALTYVRTNIAGAAFVYGSDVHSSPSVRVVATFPESSHSPILYEGVLVSSVPVRSEAERFLDFLRSDTVQALLVKDGFSGDFR